MILRKLKFKSETTIMFLFVLIPFLIILFNSVIFDETHTNLNNIDENYSHPENQIKSSSYYPGVSPITINGDSGWEPINDTYPWCTGKGTSDEHYIIDSVLIDGDGAGLSGIICMYIHDSTCYFEIRNCSFYDSGENGADDAGLRLYNVQNGKILDCNISANNRYGCYIETCQYIEVINCSFKYNDYADWN